MKFNKASRQLQHLELPTRSYIKHSSANAAATTFGSEYGPESVSKQQDRKTDRKRLRSRAVYGQVPAKQIPQPANIVTPQAGSEFTYGMPNADNRNLPNLAPKPVRQHRRQRKQGWESAGQALGWRAERTSRQDALTTSHGDRISFRPQQKQ